MEEEILNLELFEDVDSNTIKKLLPIFLEEIKKDVDMLSTAIKNDDSENIKLLIHKIDGVAKTFGAEELVCKLKKIRGLIINKDNTDYSIQILTDSAIKIEKCLENVFSIRY